MKVLPIYFLCFCAVTVLGYFGGELTYAGRIINGPKAYAVGQQIFSAHCTACHPGGGNAIDPSKPILRSGLLQNQDVFNMWLRHPAEPMPPFPSSKISDDQVKELYAYIRNVLMTK